jgi:predicted PurR-regulated permease PerM
MWACTPRARLGTPLNTPKNSSLHATLNWFSLAALAALVSCIYLLGAVLTPFVVGAMLAYVLRPAVDALCGRPQSASLPQRRSRSKFGWLMPRWASVLIVLILFLMAVLALIFLLLPILVKESLLLQQQVPLLTSRWLDALSQHYKAWLQPQLAQMGIHFVLDLESLKAWLMHYAQANAEDGLRSAWQSLRLGGGVALGLLGNAVLIPLVLFYLLLDWHALSTQLLRWFPLRWQASAQTFNAEVDSLLGQYLRGQLAVMLVLAVFYSMGLALFGLDLALPIGVFTGLAVCVPYVGFGLGLLLALVAGLLQWGFGQTALMLLLVFGAGQVIEGFVLTPRWVGQRIGLHPLAVIFALLAFGQLFGFVGVLLALPASAVLLVALRRVQTAYFTSGFYQLPRA